MVNFGSEDKRAVLTTLYSQVQHTALTVRDYLIKLTTATSALFLALDGWILTGKVQLHRSQRVGLILAILLLLGVAGYAAMRFYREFQAVARLIVHVETGLGLYEADSYIPGRALYPVEYQSLGTNEYAHGHHILAAPVLIMSIFGVFSVLIILLF